MFVAMTITPWNRNHMAFPELRGGVGFHAHCPAFQRSRILTPTSRGIPCLGRADARRYVQEDNARHRERLREACYKSGEAAPSTRRRGVDAPTMPFAGAGESTAHTGGFTSLTDHQLAAKAARNTTAKPPPLGRPMIRAVGADDQSHYRDLEQEPHGAS